MKRWINDRWPCGAWADSFLLFLLAAALMLSGCGGSGSSSSPLQNSMSISGNWQFKVANPTDNSFLGGLQGGFLLQKNSSVTGEAVYSISLPPSQSGGNPTICNSGSAPVAGTISGQNVTLTAVGGNQTFSFSGTLGTDGTTMVGTYSSTDGKGCGTAQKGLQWSAKFVPPVTGNFTGVFHSTNGAAGLGNQNFPVAGSLTQGNNIGASNTTVTGTLSFIDPTTSASDYPCFSAASLNGQISGNTIILQITGYDGSNLGQIGATVGSGVNAVTVDSTASGYVMHSLASPAYAVNSKSCLGASLNNPGDSGNICFALNGTNACQQPVTLSPPVLAFPAQSLGTTASQAITLTNNDPSGSTLNGLLLQFSFNSGVFGGPSDFDGLPNFAEQDTCASSLGSSFTLSAGQSCSITISFAPQQSCPWIPYGMPPSQSGAPPAYCPFPVAATLTLNSPASADNNTTFAVPITGIGTSAVTPSVPELDFGAEALSEASQPQQLTLTNNSGQPVQILSSAPCQNPVKGQNKLPHPLQDFSAVAGLQVVANGNSSVGSIFQEPPTIVYSCDSDPKTLLPNFQISSDTCTGRLLIPNDTCSLQITYVPQPAINLNSGLDYFLEFNTLQCSSTDNITSDCEIDSGRFPVELKANAPSPLRMSQGAGLDFGNQTVGQASGQQAITLFNDPADPNSGTVNFVGRIVVRGDYSETDNCPFSLPPSGSCTLTVTFKPKVKGFDPGSLTINVTPNPSGAPQTIQLRGSGQ